MGKTSDQCLPSTGRCTHLIGISIAACKALNRFVDAMRGQIRRVRIGHNVQALRQLRLRGDSNDPIPKADQQILTRCVCVTWRDDDWRSVDGILAKVDTPDFTAVVHQAELCKTRQDGPFVRIEPL
jgi:hypothetical protein